MRAGWAISVGRVQRLWRQEGLAEAQYLATRYLDDCNQRRLHSSLGQQAPAECAAAFAAPDLAELRVRPHGLDRFQLSRFS